MNFKLQDSNKRLLRIEPKAPPIIELNFRQKTNFIWVSAAKKKFEFFIFHYIFYLFYYKDDFSLYTHTHTYLRETQIDSPIILEKDHIKGHNLIETHKL